MPNSRDPNKKNINQWLLLKQIEAIENKALSLGMNRSDFIRNSLEITTLMSNEEFLRLLDEIDELKRGLRKNIEIALNLSKKDFEDTLKTINNEE